MEAGARASLDELLKPVSNASEVLCSYFVAVHWSKRDCSLFLNYFRYGRFCCFVIFPEPIKQVWGVFISFLIARLI